MLNYLQQVEQNVQLLNSLVNDIQDFSQISNHQLRINITQFLLSDVVSEIESLMRILAEAKGLRFEVSTAIRLEKVRMHSDKMRLKQILINLLGNAIKFTFEGGIKLSITEEEEEVSDKGGEVHLSSSSIYSVVEDDSQRSWAIRFSVKDSGVGIEDNIKEQLFQMYGTFDVHQMNGRGVGLGLFISKCLVTLLGPKEEISIDTTVGVGSTFSFFIFKDIRESPRSERLTIPSHNIALSAYSPVRTFPSHSIPNSPSVQKINVFPQRSAAVTRTKSFSNNPRRHHPPPTISQTIHFKDKQFQRSLSSNMLYQRARIASTHQQQNLAQSSSSSGGGGGAAAAGKDQRKPLKFQR